MAINMTNDLFEAEVLNSDIPVVVDFWATWCGPCKMMGPVVDELSAEYDGKVKVCKVNVDEERQLAMRFGVMSIPTIIKIEKGEEVARVVGAMTKQELIDQLGI